MRRAAALLVVSLILVAALFPAVAAAQRAGGTVVVESGERVEGFTATAGTVVVRGTVTGDVRAYAGSVVVEEGGVVEGRLRAYAGSTRIAGTVEENVVVYAGSVTVERTGEVGASLGAAAGNVVVAGTVRGDATLASGAVTVDSTAHVTGDLNYEGSLSVAPGARVDGETRHVRDLDVGPSPPAIPGLFLLYGVLADLLLGAVMLRLFPDFSLQSVESILVDPVQSAGVGLATVVAVPVVLALVALTVVGIPLALAGGGLFAVLAWIGHLYGRLAVGVVVLSYTEYEDVRLALVVGVVLVAVATRIPLLGWLVRIAVLAVGVGPVALALREWYRRHRRRAGDRGVL